MRIYGIAVLAFCVCLGAERTALDEYVAAPDPSFRYQLVRTLPGPGWTAFVLDLTSQSWLTPAEVDRTLWQHWLIIVKPDKVATSTALLLIGGGNNGGKPPERLDPSLALIASASGSIVAALQQVPNQPLTFAGETQPRREDALIAYTWDKFLRTGDARWPARLPMTKSVVRAMDAVTAFCASPQAGGVPIERFVVSGGSKRGWTAWTTAAVDRRLAAVAPAVIDVLNLQKCLVHEYRSYGFWAPALKDYVDMRIMDWFGTPQLRTLLRIEEPYQYRHRLTMPKYIVNSAGDQFFFPESSRFYFDDLPGEKHLRYIPNTDHSLKNSDVYLSLAAFYEALVRGRPRPSLSWKFERDGSIRVRTAGRPSEVKLWQATNPKARDFRFEAIGAAWRSSPLQDQGGGVYVARVGPPPTGWTAFFIELSYPLGGPFPFKVTTAVRVTPERLPFPAPRPARTPPPPR
jgi:PhoPQ-activated pathogenicity-related protein